MSYTASMSRLVSAQSPLCPSIALLDNDPITLAGLSQIIEQHHAGRVIWTTSSAQQAVHDCCDPATRPDVLVTDVSMKPLSGGEVCHRIRRRLSRPAILAITSFPLTVYEQEASASGAQGIASKADVSALVNAVRTVSAGGTWGQGFEPAAIAHLRISSQRIDRGVLSGRESEAMDLLAQGYAVSVVAVKMNVTGSAVKSYIARAKSKMGATSLRELIAMWTGENQ
ncbi:response regulator transcription factor [Bifidobacterium leontopitheci]|uniref:DNA-binding response regulator n=2 Tax=Bifidobacterium leontopitheci TaxID=2650774 RepID=A0A6I1GPW2_9BIFI|nr:response regulator transcription factor [Bifidobacterium leontopitheci]KAB7791429.1 DNA-binding response regulator [Bifidobacterium leontopitheci]